MENEEIDIHIGCEGGNEPEGAPVRDDGVFIAPVRGDAELLSQAVTRRLRNVMGIE